ncbi:hypothetical protein Plhal304r1_c009g0036191 [Plasmopara halstedii]
MFALHQPSVIIWSYCLFQIGYLVQWKCKLDVKAGLPKPYHDFALAGQSDGVLCCRRTCVSTITCSWATLSQRSNTVLNHCGCHDSCLSWRSYKNAS